MFENKRHDWIITFAKSGGIGLDELGAKKQESVANKEGSEKKKAESGCCLSTSPQRTRETIEKKIKALNLRVPRGPFVKPSSEPEPSLLTQPSSPSL